MDEIPTKPYLMRALYQWCVDNRYTPHIAARVDARTQVPSAHVRNGEITLNIAPAAVHKLEMGNEFIEFSARFAGLARQISVPVANVYALYARETGTGMTFELESAAPAAQVANEGEDAASAPAAGQPAAPSEPPRPPTGGKPTLRRVK